MKKIWLAKIRRDETSSSRVLCHTKVCSEHFLESDFPYRGIGKKWNNRRLKKLAIPSCFKWSPMVKSRVNPLEKCERRSLLHDLQTKEKDQEKLLKKC